MNEPMIIDCKLAPWMKEHLTGGSNKAKVVRLLHAINYEGMLGRAQVGWEHEMLADVIIDIVRRESQ